MHWGYYGWGIGLGWFFMIMLWVLVILGVVYFFRALMGTEKKGSEETALDILKKRYAKGEISREEFERIREDLMKQ